MSSNVKGWMPKAPNLSIAITIHRKQKLKNHSTMILTAHMYIKTAKQPEK